MKWVVVIVCEHVCVQVAVAVMYGFMILRFGHLSLLERFPKSKENKQIVLYVPLLPVLVVLQTGAHPLAQLSQSQAQAASRSMPPSESPSH